MKTILNPKHWEQVLDKTEANLKALKELDDYQPDQESYQILEGFYKEKIKRVKKRIELLNA